MLSRLRHDPVIGRDDEKCKICAADARQHIAYETLMARRIDESDYMVVAAVPISETQIDRYSAATLFGQAIRLDTGESPDERGFSVIYMAGCCNDHQCGTLSRARNLFEPLFPNKVLNEGLLRAGAIRECQGI